MLTQTLVRRHSSDCDGVGLAGSNITDGSVASDASDVAMSGMELSTHV